MTKNEAVSLIQMIITAWPNFHNGKTDAEDLGPVVNAWYFALAEFEKEFIYAGLKPLMQSHKFPPSIAEVISTAQNVEAAANDIMADPPSLEMQKQSLIEQASSGPQVS